jgi:Tfp pilus assembly protein PilF
MNERAEEFFRQAFGMQREGRLDEAIELYRKSIEEDPSAEAHTFLGWTYSFQGRYEDAIEECRRAIGVDPGFGNPYNDIGAYLVELGRFDEAVEWLEKAIRAPRYEPRHYPHFNLARIHARRHDWGAAIEHLRKAVELEPRYSAARKELDKLLARMN